MEWLGGCVRVAVGVGGGRRPVSVESAVLVRRCVVVEVCCGDNVAASVEDSGSDAVRWVVCVEVTP